MKMKSYLTWIGLLAVVSLGLWSISASTQGDQNKMEPAIVKMTIEGKGDIYIQLNTKESPKTCENFIKLVKQKFYDGILFHRVVPGFVVQAGDPQTKKYTSQQLAAMSDQELQQAKLGSGGPGWTIKFEPNPLKHEKGSLGMARTPDPDSAGSQFYICLEPQPRLDGQYVVFGKVVKGMDLVMKIQRGDKIKEARIVEKVE